ncbi:MAG: hypothetical protein ACPGLV_16780 [Bacteroidia bacterium]
MIRYKNKLYYWKPFFMLIRMGSLSNQFTEGDFDYPLGIND